MIFFLFGMNSRRVQPKSQANKRKKMCSSFDRGLVRDFVYYLSL